MPCVQEYEAARKTLEGVKSEREEAKKRVSSLRQTLGPMLKKTQQINSQLQPTQAQIRTKVQDTAVLTRIHLIYFIYHKINIFRAEPIIEIAITFFLPTSASLSLTKKISYLTCIAVLDFASVTPELIGLIKCPVFFQTANIKEASQKCKQRRDQLDRKQREARPRCPVP